MKDMVEEEESFEEEVDVRGGDESAGRGGGGARRKTFSFGQLDENWTLGEPEGKSFSSDSKLQDGKHEDSCHKSKVSSKLSQYVLLVLRTSEKKAF